ncbi:hypothetical protein KAR91_42000 [Candidatus Pacearchaeota archaeon]|nr:hypothetical protein [Candidatus Pacearchaeota archaeon]
MASEVQICNLALLKFGNITINSLEDNTSQAQACKELYPLMRDELMSLHEWNFALARADISSELKATPAFQYDFAYQLPGDCLRVIELYGTGAKWAREGNEFLTNQEEAIFIRYVKKVTTTGDFSQVFVNALAVRLAGELVAKIKEDKNMRLELLNELERVILPEAFRINAIEGNRELKQGEKSLDAQTYPWQARGRGATFVKRTAEDG